MEKGRDTTVRARRAGLEEIVLDCGSNYFNTQVKKSQQRGKEQVLPFAIWALTACCGWVAKSICSDMLLCLRFVREQHS